MITSLYVWFRQASWKEVAAWAVALNVCLWTFVYVSIPDNGYSEAIVAYRSAQEREKDAQMKFQEAGEELHQAKLGTASALSELLKYK